MKLINMLAILIVLLELQVIECIWGFLSLFYCVGTKLGEVWDAFSGILGKEKQAWIKEFEILSWNGNLCAFWIWLPLKPLEGIFGRGKGAQMWESSGEMNEDTSVVLNLLYLKTILVGWMRTLPHPHLPYFTFTFHFTIIFISPPNTFRPTLSTLDFFTFIFIFTLFSLISLAEISLLHSIFFIFVHLHGISGSHIFICASTFKHV